MKCRARHFIMVISWWCISGLFSAYGSEIDSAEAITEPAAFPEVLADTCGAAVIDSSAFAGTDTVMTEDKYKVDYLCDLIKPIVLTSLVGGLLLLIFTQRSR